MKPLFSYIKGTLCGCMGKLPLDLYLALRQPYELITILTHIGAETSCSNFPRCFYVACYCYGRCSGVLCIAVRADNDLPTFLPQPRLTQVMIIVHWTT